MVKINKEKMLTAYSACKQASEIVLASLWFVLFGCVLLLNMTQSCTGKPEIT